MRFLQNLPIKRKLVIITMLTTLIALGAACLAFFTYEQLTARKRIVQNLSATAKMTGANCAAGLTFNEPGSVEQSLQALSVQPSVLHACVYDKDGRPFARYHRDDTDGDFAVPPVQFT
ncbi:MAG: hypothetical protein H7Y43_18320, partial [Akkermansiaceae bacterium]|nr:hypothetical protein [Verrucomicrobiales bacterium]